MIGIESIFEKCLCLGELCNGYHLYKNAYKVLTFENISIESVGVFVSVSAEMVLVCEQATTSVLPTQKVLVLFLLL